MKWNNKFLIATIVVSILTLSSVIPSIAANYKHNNITAANAGHTTFSKAWKDYAVVKVDGKYYDCTIGYDTWCTKEDYIKNVYAQNNNGKTYYGKVKNSKGITDVTSRASGKSKTGKADVKHTGKKVTYYIYAR